METAPMTIIDLVSDDGEDMPTSCHNARNLSSSHSCGVSPSLSTTNSIDKSQKGKGSSSFVLSQTPSSKGKTARTKIAATKNTAGVSSRKIIRSVPIKILPKPTQLEYLHKVNIVTPGTSSSNDDTTKNQKLQGKPGPKSKKKLYLISPIVNDPNNPITKIVLLKPNSAVDKSTLLKVKGEEVLKKPVIGKPSNQQQIQMQHNISTVDNAQVQVQRESAKPNIIRQQRVYVKELRDSMTEERDRMNTDLKNTPFSTTTNVTDEQDPLYIPGMQLRERLTSARVSPYPNDPYRRAITPNPTRKKPQRRTSHSPAPPQDPLFIPSTELQEKMAVSFFNMMNSKDSPQPQNKSERAKTPKPTKIAERRKSQYSVPQKDPLYTPGRKLQEKVSPPSIFRDAIVSLPAHSRPKRAASVLRKTPEPRISQYQESESDEDHADMDIFTPIVTLTEPTNSEHSVVTNYSLLNKVATNKEGLRVRSQSVPPKLIKNKVIDSSTPVFQKIHLKDVPSKTAKKDRVVNSDLVYRKIILTDVLKSDNCRNFFIKNSAWDYLEPVFKGFNEREQNISESCSKYFSRLLNKSGEKRQREIDSKYLTNDELFYTRKIEVLDKEGKLDKVYYVPPENQVSRKRRANSLYREPEIKKCKDYYVTSENQVTRKRRASSVYRLPETKKCKVVLQREEYVENLLKKYLMRERLNSLLSEQLSIQKGDSNKPLIILNRVNFNVLKVNDILCKHANIIYVKHAEEGFPDKLFKNDFLVSQMEKKVIRMVTPNALKYYFQ